ncbi:hypothetical protein HYC85_028435 [Camellia sinensis]|uniref:non-specific serine/threonine protein kinase n=1 Tax=Camellia sinensis TaxID=4442 RepID=A0A7J7FZ70_CAMSI|nr:hypothetical protein HYC85_028435 [Camellia sinensis]
MVINLGSSLSPTSGTPPTSWSSSSGLFAFGFYTQDTGFKVGIWLVLNRTKTVVWTANRDDPPITSINSTLELTRNGKLVLRTEHGKEKLIANTTGSAASALMLDSGNFVLYDTDSRVIWESFNFPTDTILGGQTLAMGAQLISSLSDTQYSTGRYKLIMQADGKLVLYPLNTADRGLDAYWASGTLMKVPKSLSLYLNQSTGTLDIINSTSLRIIKSFKPESSYKNNKTIIYRATLDFDGVLRFFCTLDDNQPYCRCIPGTDFVDPNKWSLGCDTNFPRKGCETGIENDTTSFSITTMENIECGDLPYAQESQMSIEDCEKSCLEDCYCEAADYSLDHRYCNKQSLPLMYVRRNVVGASSKLTAIFKVRIIKIRQELTLHLFSYSELRKATNGFKEELGKGSFGAVYKGTLCRGKRLIAVKKLQKVVEEGEREFQAEMRAMGRKHHRNLVQLLGYCIEGSKRLLVYEYMSNGSLADLLFKSKRSPDWNERIRIALNVARGILYLHDECETPIIHCDIKPENILMDEFWNAKISDFGLAKFLMPDQMSSFTGVRGTRGYLAPEWQRNNPISVKADVYSYGIMLLEIVCCRRSLEVNVSTSEEVVLSHWVYRCFAGRELNKLIVVGDEDVDMKTLENMVKVGLWCIQDEPALRPSMKSVVLMLEGITDISIPPCPTTS